MTMHALGKICVFLLLLCGMYHIAPYQVWAWTAEVLSVSDGDSFKIRQGKRIIKVRLYGIDSPEYGQPYWRAARTEARGWLKGIVEIEPMYKDRYGRTVALVWSEGRLVNAALVQSGMAWVYPRFCRSRELCQHMETLQQAARQARLGLWQDEKPEPPWQWKRRQGQGRRS
ncbi:MAG: thermonuclease family protein [Desulfobulbus sp.]|jgi:micrococcal nuclease